MNKFAMMICTNGAYLTGVNATLMTMEIYKMHEKIDIYILLWPDGFIPNNDEFLKWKDQYPYINFVVIDKKISEISDDFFFNITHVPYKFALENLVEKYDVILHWGGDVCLVSDIYDYFFMAQGSNKIILGENEFGCRSYYHMTPELPYNHTWDIPYVDVPFFLPTNHADVLRYELELQGRKDNTLASMDGLVYAIRDLKKEVISLPGKLWILTTMHPGMIEYNMDESGVFLYYDKMRMNSFHGRYWWIGWCNGYIKNGSDAYQHNAKVFNTVYANLNSNYRVKWPHFEVWEGYPQT